MSRILTVILFMGFMQAAYWPSYGQGPIKQIVSEMNGFSTLSPCPEGYLFSAAVGVAYLEHARSNPSQVVLSIPGYYANGEEGAPALPETSILFEADSRYPVHMSIEAMDSVLIDLNLAGFEGTLVPFHASERKGVAAMPTRMDSAVYSMDGWTGGEVLSVAYEGRMRGLSMSTLHFNPVKYNPARNLLKIYYNVRCAIQTGRSLSPVTEPAFSALYSRVVRREPQGALKAVSSEEPMTLVILSDTMFRETLVPFVEWKTRKGFRVVEAYRTDSLVGGTRESIKAYLKNLYDQAPSGVARPTYLLIVGDTEHIPLSQSQGEITDLYYAEYDGEGDYIPDLFYGRISVSSKVQLQGIVEKILEYEQYLFTDPSFLDQSVLIAGVDGSYASTYGNGQINYAQNNYLNAEQGIQTHMFRYPESDTSAQTILDLISGGVGFVNYTGHGEVDRWRDPAFRISDINQLQNIGKYPVMIGNGCETNYFLARECFAEALLRASDKGALAYIGCTNDSYWDEDYYWAVGVGPIGAQPAYEESGPGYYDKVFHTHQEARKLWTPSLGEMVFGGNMAVQQSSSFRKKFYWEIYQLAGDPTIVPWFSQPSSQDVLLPDWIPSGAGRVDVHCAPYSYLSLSQDGILLDALHTSDKGYATLHIPDSLSPGNLEIVVTGDRYQPFIKEIVMADDEGPYLELLGYSLSSESVDEDLHINPGEELRLNLQLINRGKVALTHDTLLLFSAHHSIQVLDSIHILEEITPGDTVDIQNIFRITSSDQLADQADAVMGIQLKSSGSPFYLKEEFHAPLLESGGIYWEDRSLGNGNGIPEQGEWLLCTWKLINTGHFRTGEVQGNFDPALSVMVEEILFRNSAVLNPGEGAELEFEIQLGGSGNAWLGQGLLSAGDPSGSVADSFFVTTGRYYDDFSQGKSGRIAYMDSSLVAWSITGETYASAQQSLRSGKITHAQVSEFSVTFETTEDDTLFFSYRVSSESFYDYLMFFADSTLVKQWSGETGWNSFYLFLEAGKHEMIWSYQKDSNISQREDAAWIDDIIFPSSAFRKGDLALMEITEPDSDPWLSDHEQVKARVRNTSADTIQGYMVRFSLNGMQFTTDDHRDILLPGQEEEITAWDLVDLSGFGSHLLEAELVQESFGYWGNNSLKKEVEHKIFPELSLTLGGVDQKNGRYARALVHAENTGNIPLDSLRYTIMMDSLPSQSGILFLGLEPGQQTTLSLSLVDSLDQLDPGSYSYLIRAMDTNSLLWQNQVEGLLFWYSLDIIPRERSMDWSIYPNPTTSGFQLKLSQPAEQDYLFELVSMAGRVLDAFTVKWGDDQAWIPQGSAAPGIYLLRLVHTGEYTRLVIHR